MSVWTPISCYDVKCTSQPSTCPSRKHTRLLSPWRRDFFLSSGSSPRVLWGPLPSIQWQGPLSTTAACSPPFSGNARQPACELSRGSCYGASECGQRSCGCRLPGASPARRHRQGPLCHLEQRRTWTAAAPSIVHAGAERMLPRKEFSNEHMPLGVHRIS